METILGTIFQNEALSALFIFMGEFAATKSLEHLIDRTRCQNATERLSSQLLQCLRSAHEQTCIQFNWEYNDDAFLQILETDASVWSQLDNINQLVDLLSKAVGADETGIVTPRVAAFWLETLDREIACQQELHNYIHNKRTAISSCTHTIKNDNKVYQDAFYEALFLEDSLEGAKNATLSDVYIPPKYRIRTGDEEKRISIFETLISFFTCKNNAFLQQDPSFPIANQQPFAVMLMGKPGIGKSSFVSYLAVKLQDELSNRPYHIIRLRNMLETQINSDDPITGLLNYMRTDSRGLDNSVLILDGLDEICAIYKNTNFHTYLKRLLNNLSTIPGLQLVLTSRTGYFRIDNAIKSLCGVINIDHWDENDLDDWSTAYTDIHPELSEIITSNKNHLQDAKYSGKKAIFAVPILFYMANARGEHLEQHSSICSVYDAVLTEVAGARNYDNSPYFPNGELITPELARQICREIAFTMFRHGRLSMFEQSVSVDPYLSPDEVDSAVADAIQIWNASSYSLDERSKQKIKNFYALTFYYNKDNSNQNAVEFAHKTIAEYFVSEKIIEMLKAGSATDNETEFNRTLAECFGYAPITNDILIYVYEKIKLMDNSAETNQLKTCFERYALPGMLSSTLFLSPLKHKSDLHYIDRANIMIKSVLMVFEYLDCNPGKVFPTENLEFNNLIATASRSVAIKAHHSINIPIALNGFSLKNGDFSCGEFWDAHLSGADLTHTKFTDANLTDAQLSGSTIVTADFSGANLAGADLSNINSCDGSDFTQAALESADLRWSSFQNTSFESAELQGAYLEHCVFGPGCHFDDANLYLANLDNADFSQADINGAIFADSDDDDKVVIYNLKLTQSQLEYISSFPQVELVEPFVFADKK